MLKSAKNGFLNKAIHHLAVNININNAHWVRAGSKRQLETNILVGRKNLLVALIQFLFHLLISLILSLIMMRIPIGTALERWGMHLTCAEGFLSFCEVDSKLYFKVWDLLLYTTKKIYIIIATSSKARDILPWVIKMRGQCLMVLWHIFYILAMTNALIMSLWNFLKFFLKVLNFLLSFTKFSSAIIHDKSKTCVGIFQ